MARSVKTHSSSQCGDCGAIDPQWASINKGILICSDCCSIHISLGRHISQVRSLQKKEFWPPSLLHLVNTLHSSGANSVWEHTLLDPTVGGKGPIRRKPNSRDSLHPVKAEFIKSKYKRLAFVLRPQGKEDLQPSADINKQLHSSVRTSNLKTTIRLLALGADPNYIHPEKGNSGIHVAAKAGQLSQVELLVVYGANPKQADAHGLTPLDYAKSGKHEGICRRLVELEYELTDRLAYFLCQRRPDHSSSQHFIVPELALTPSEEAARPRHPLQELSDHFLAAFTRDIYDEVDRREVYAAWQSQEKGASPSDIPPSLPPVPDISPQRNTARQKLAALSPREFAILVIDLLAEIRRRHFGGPSSLALSSVSFKVEGGRAQAASAMDMALRPLQGQMDASEEDPIYDSVASEEDYSLVEIQSKLADAQQILALQSNREQLVGAAKTSTPIGDDDRHRTSSIASILSDLSAAGGEGEKAGGANEDEEEGRVTREEYDRLKDELQDSRKSIEVLVKERDRMAQEISTLQSMVGEVMRRMPHPQQPVQKLMQENALLRRDPSTGRRVSSLPNGHNSLCLLDEDTCGGAKMRFTPSTSPSSGRAISMYEPRQGIHRCHSPKGIPLVVHPLGSPNFHSGTAEILGTTIRVQSDMEFEEQEKKELPSKDEVLTCMRGITGCIQEMLVTLQRLEAEECTSEEFLSSIEQVNQAVTNMIALFPLRITKDEVQEAVNQLVSSAARLVHLSRPSRRSKGEENFSIEHQRVFDCAYDVAKATKQLVTLFD